MANEPIQLRRTVNPHPLVLESADGTTVGRLREGEPAIAIAPSNVTKLWVGDGTANRLLLSTDLTDAPLLTAGYAPLASPTLTGVPIAPTPVVGTNTTQLATTAFVQAAVGGLVVHSDANQFSGNGTAGSALTIIRIDGGTY